MSQAPVLVAVTDGGQVRHMVSGIRVNAVQVGIVDTPPHSRTAFDAVSSSGSRAT